MKSEKAKAELDSCISGWLSVSEAEELVEISEQQAIMKVN